MTRGLVDKNDYTYKQLEAAREGTRFANRERLVYEFIASLFILALCLLAAWYFDKQGKAHGPRATQREVHSTEMK